MALFEYFWEKLVPGAVVPVDDYGAPGRRSHKISIHRAARELGQELLTLPACQGLVIRE